MLNRLLLKNKSDTTPLVSLLLKSFTLKKKKNLTSWVPISLPVWFHPPLLSVGSIQATLACSPEILSSSTSRPLHLQFPLPGIPSQNFASLTHLGSCSNIQRTPSKIAHTQHTLPHSLVPCLIFFIAFITTDINLSSVFPNRNVNSA